jgi:hypothetical protein
VIALQQTSLIKENKMETPLEKTTNKNLPAKIDETPPSKKSKTENLPSFVSFIKHDDVNSMIHFIRVNGILKVKQYFETDFKRIASLNPGCKGLIYKHLPNLFKEYAWKTSDFNLLIKNDLELHDNVQQLKEAIEKKKTNLFEQFIFHGTVLKNMTQEHLELAIDSEFPIVLRCMTTKKLQNFSSLNELTCPSCEKFAKTLIVKVGQVARCSACFETKRDWFAYPFSPCLKCSKINNTIYDMCYDCFSLIDAALSKKHELFLTSKPENVVEQMDEAELNALLRDILIDVEQLKDHYLRVKYDNVMETCEAIVHKTNWLKKSIPIPNPQE